MAKSREEILAVRRARERLPANREKRRAYKNMKQHEYFERHPDAAERNRQRALWRYAETKAYQWLSQLFADAAMD